MIFTCRGLFFFQAPLAYDFEAVRPKWTHEKALFFSDLVATFTSAISWEAGLLDQTFKDIAAGRKIKPGELQLPLRIMLVGGKFGPPVFEIAEMIGRDETVERIRRGVVELSA